LLVLALLLRQDFTNLHSFKSLPLVDFTNVSFQFVSRAPVRARVAVYMRYPSVLPFGPLPLLYFTNMYFLFVSRAPVRAQVTVYLRFPPALHLRAILNNYYHEVYPGTIVYKGAILNYLTFQPVDTCLVLKYVAKVVVNKGANLNRLTVQPVG